MPVIGLNSVGNPNSFSTAAVINPFIPVSGTFSSTTNEAIPSFGSMGSTLGSSLLSPVVGSYPGL